MIDVDLSKKEERRISRQLDKLAEMAGITIRDVAYETMRLAGNNAIKFTYPRKKGAGRGAIAQDANALFTSIGRHGKIWETSDGRGWTKLESGAIVSTKGTDGVATTKSIADVRSIWNRKRSGSGYRVAKQSNHRKVFAEKRHVDGVIREKAKRVGQMKAGWIPGAAYFAKLAHGVVKAPAWVSSQARKQGKAVGSVSAFGIGGLGIDNDLPYMKGPEKTHVVDIVHSLMRQDIFGGFAKRLPRLIARFNQARGVAS